MIHLRTVLIRLTPCLLAAGLASAAACSAGSGATSTGGEEGGGNGDGGSTGNGFNTGGSTGSTGPACTDPACVGNTPQGMCDTGLAIDGANPMDGAKAIGLCQVSDGTTWGVKTAEWVGSNGQQLSGSYLLGVGILDRFGANVGPREGQKVLGISSGAARQPTDPGYQDVGGYVKGCETSPDPNCPFLGIQQTAPPGFPKESPSCPGVVTGAPYDSAGLRLTIKTPTDAKSYKFDLDFYTYEFPVYICDVYNDFFVALVNPPPTGSSDGNISFDAMGNLVSVNAGFLEVCTPQTAGGKNFACVKGPSELTGTGFEEHAATGWLETTAPVEAPGGDITVHFVVWDSGDPVLDSSALIDNFRFELSEGQTGTVPVPE